MKRMSGAYRTGWRICSSVMRRWPPTRGVHGCKCSRSGAAAGSAFRSQPTNAIRSATPCRAALPRATSSAAGEMSVATHLAPVVG